MSSNKKASQPKRHFPKWLKGFLVYATSIVAIIVVVFGVFSVALAGQIYPRVSVNGIVLGGLKPEDAKKRLDENKDKHILDPVILTDGAGHSFTIKPDEVSAAYDIDQSVAAAMAIGRGKNWFNNLVQKLTTPLFGLDIPATVRVNDEQLAGKVNTIVSTVAIPEKNADLLIKNGVVTVAPSAVGQNVDKDQLRQQILDALGRNDTDPIEIVIKKKEPAIIEPMAETVKASAEKMLADSIRLTYKDQTFTATPAIIGGWLQTKVETKLFQSKLTLSINEDTVVKYIESIAGKIDVEPQNARLAVVNGTITIIEASHDGSKVKRDTAKTDILRLLSLRQDGALTSSPSPSDSISPTAAISPSASPEIGNNEVTLEVETKKPDVTNDNINSIGIKERIAVSTTDFKGSPANRTENIKLGTKLFNGIILKPGDTFSAVKSLGRIDAESGFKPELVIKEDQLATEIGGGLCQVSTTLFRAAMNAGLDIAERRNHRFRVGYYEARPAVVDPEDYVTLNAKTLVGMDATIYDPLPDFKFTNDTGNYMLIQGRIEGTRLTFELFGTKDGRKTAIDGPYITSTTPAPSEILYIDEPNLPAGVTKVKESAHAGAKTSFTYTVTKDGKQIHKNTFTSSYVPWQAKSYRGTGPAASPSPSPVPSVDPNATLTPAVTPTP
jgi:vancomycin resistance protein YoaR